MMDIDGAHVQVRAMLNYIVPDAISNGTATISGSQFDPACQDGTDVALEQACTLLLMSLL